MTNPALRRQLLPMADVGPARDVELVDYLAQGDLRAAGSWLVDRHARDVIGLCRAMVRPRDAADDLAQDTFSAAFAALKGFRRDASARTWLLAIARNRCIDHLRREQRAPFDDWDADDAPDDYAHPGPLPPDVLLTRDDVSAALGRLGESERALAVLRFRHGLEYSELADVFGVRQGTVRMRLSRALASMRDELEAREQPAAQAAELEAVALGEAAPDEAAVPQRARGRASLPRGSAPAVGSRTSTGGGPPGGFGGPPPPPPLAGPARPAPARAMTAPPPAQSRSASAPFPPAKAPAAAVGGAPPRAGATGFFGRFWHWLRSGSDAPPTTQSEPTEDVMPFD
ncbi:MAG TPA: RNA polymerase sigma factor, partial [Polyangiaceae bacterium]|nr:RNA polymerase sigma factor [Polyangiaceae bacterium]